VLTCDLFAVANFLVINICPYDVMMMSARMSLTTRHTDYLVLQISLARVSGLLQEDESYSGCGDDEDDGYDEYENTSEQSSTPVKFFLEQRVLLLQNLLVDLLVERSQSVAVQVRRAVLVRVDRASNAITRHRTFFLKKNETEDARKWGRNNEARRIEARKTGQRASWRRTASPLLTSYRV